MNRAKYCHRVALRQVGVCDPILPSHNCHRDVGAPETGMEGHAWPQGVVDLDRHPAISVGAVDFDAPAGIGDRAEGGERHLDHVHARYALKAEMQRAAR